MEQHAVVQGGILLPTKATIERENKNMRDALEKVRSELAMLQGGQSRQGSVNTEQLVGFVKAMTDIIGSSCCSTVHHTGALDEEGRPAAGRAASPSAVTAALLGVGASSLVATPAKLPGVAAIMV